MKNFYKGIALCAILLIPAVSFASFDVSLKYGSKGQAVVDLQDFLTDQGTYTGKMDGRFGLGTLKSVEAWQTSVGLSPDGYFGKASRATANTVLASLLQASDATEQAETGTVSNSTTIDGCTSTDGFSVTTGQKCDGTVPKAVSDIGTQARLDIISSQLNTIAQNTTPSITVDILDTTQTAESDSPVYVTTDELGTGLSMEWSSKGPERPLDEIFIPSLSIWTNNAQVGDIVTLTFNNGTPDTKIVNHVGGDGIGVAWSFNNLNYNLNYPVYVEIQRGNQIATENLTAIDNK